MSEPYFIEKGIKKLVAKYRKAFKGTESEFDDYVKSKLPKIIEELLQGIWDGLYNYSFDENNDLRSHQKKINESIEKKYGDAIKLVESFIEMNSQVSVSTYGTYLKIFDTFEDQLKLDTLISLHVRACQIANEIRVLVSNGYADGAMSRWRTLHELCVTFLFLYDNDTRITEMYQDYHVIERWKKAKEYQENCSFLKMDKLSNEDIAFIESERKDVLEEYGKEFGQSYGWTMNVLPKGRRNIREMEKVVGQDHHRAVYTWASENVHSGVSGINKRLGLREDEENYFLPGANDYGFLAPIQYMTASLITISETFLNMEDSIMSRIFKEFLYSLQNEVVLKFDILERDT